MKLSNGISTLLLLSWFREKRTLRFKPEDIPKMKAIARRDIGEYVAFCGKDKTSDSLLEILNSQ